MRVDPLKVATVVMILLTALIVSGIVYTIWYEYRYPCLRSVPEICYSMDCAVYNSDGLCAGYYSRAYACERCLERGVRK